MLGVVNPLVVMLTVRGGHTWNGRDWGPVVGAAGLTVSVKFCSPFGLTPFCAVNVMTNVPDAVGVPLSVPVPLQLLRTVTPAGKVPLSIMLVVVNPLVYTLNVPPAPTWNMIPFALVRA